VEAEDEKVDVDRTTPDRWHAILSDALSRMPRDFGFVVEPGGGHSTAMTDPGTAHPTF